MTAVGHPAWASAIIPMAEQLARRAEAALKSVTIDERLLERVEHNVDLEALDHHDLRTRSRDGKHQATGAIVHLEVVHGGAHQ